MLDGRHEDMLDTRYAGVEYARSGCCSLVLFFFLPPVFFSRHVFPSLLSSLLVLSPPVAGHFSSRKSHPAEVHFQLDRPHVYNGQIKQTNRGVMQ